MRSDQSFGVAHIERMSGYATWIFRVLKRNIVELSRLLSFIEASVEFEISR